MNFTLRPLVLPALTAAALLGVGCGSDDKTDTTASTPTKTVVKTTTTPTTSSRATSPNDQGGAQVAAGAGSPLVGAPAEAGVATAGETTSASLGRPFNAGSPWNTVVSSMAVDSRSNTWIRLVKNRIGVQENGNAAPTLKTRVVNDGVFINTTAFAPPVVQSSGGTTTRVICRQQILRCGDGSTVDSLQIPLDVSPKPQYDGWFTVLDPARGVAYDMWRARRAPGQAVMSYQYLRKWDLNGPGFLAPNAVSARGSGLPLFAGIITPEEVRAGRIDHALAISLPGPAQRKYVQPASSTDGNGSVQSMPEGAHIRLKRSVALNVAKIQARTNQRAARAIYAALRRYGAILVDRSAVPTLYAQANADWSAPLRNSQGQALDADGTLQSKFVRVLPNQGTPLLRGSEVEQLTTDDFEVVRTPGALLNYPPLNTTADPLVQTSTRG